MQACRSCNGVMTAEQTTLSHLPYLYIFLTLAQFPKYFGLSSVCLILQLASLSALAKSNNKVVLLGLWQRSQPVLVASLCLTLLNQFVWEPIATHNMLERYRMEDDNLATSEEYTKLKKSFGKYHGLSSLTNLLALCGGVAHAVYLAAALVV
jgi:hypothetical protein